MKSAIKANEWTELEILHSWRLHLHRKSRFRGDGSPAPGRTEAGLRNLLTDTDRKSHGQVRQDLNLDNSIEEVNVSKI